MSSHGGATSDPTAASIRRSRAKAVARKGVPFKGVTFRADDCRHSAPCRQPTRNASRISARLPASSSRTTLSRRCDVSHAVRSLVPSLPLRSQTANLALPSAHATGSVSCVLKDRFSGQHKLANHGYYRSAFFLCERWVPPHHINTVRGSWMEHIHRHPTKAKPPQLAH